MGSARTTDDGKATEGRLPRWAVPASVCAIVLLAALIVVAERGGPGSPIRVSVDDRPVLVDHSTTFGDAIRELSLVPSPGQLLDVEGRVLDRRADPGAILLNGRTVAATTPLAAGDEIVVVDGVDRTEGTRRVTAPIPGRRLGNPMYTLATSRMLRVETAGRISGKVIGLWYRPISDTRRPSAVALTFDDGPWPGNTRRVLEILDRMHVEAAFFMVGRLIERYPGIVRRVQRAGMTIGTHSWSHPDALVEMAPHRIATEIRRPARLLRNRFGIDPVLFRAPNGSHDDSVVWAAFEAGMGYVQWSVQARDWVDGRGARAIATVVLRSVRPGSIVLLHDGGGDRSATVRALPRIIRGIRAMGLELVALGE